MECSAGCGGRNMNKDKFNPVQRNYKDTLFRMIFSDKKALLSLYNAISEKDYKDPELELLVTMLNINLGNNSDLMNKCQTLLEYMQYVEKVRNYTSIMNINMAVEKAVNESIREGILADFLLKNKSEAVQMSIFEYDEEREMKLIRRDEREIGREEGRREGREEGIRESLKYFILDNFEEQIPEEKIVTKLQKIFGVLAEEGRRLISLYREAV